MKVLLSIATAILVAQPAIAQAPQRQASAAQMTDAQAVKDVLARYQSAIERLDATGTDQLFAADSAVFETGGSEGTYANYLAHHLGVQELQILRLQGRCPVRSPGRARHRNLQIPDRDQ